MLPEIKRFFRDLTVDTRSLIPRRQLAETEIIELKTKKSLMMDVDALRISANALHTGAWQKLGKNGTQPIHKIKEFLREEHGAVIAEDTICGLTGDVNPALQEERIYLETAQDLNTLGGKQGAISYFELITDRLKAAIENPIYASRASSLKSRVMLCDTSINAIKAFGSLEKSAKEILPRP